MRGTDRGLKVPTELVIRQPTKSVNSYKNGVICCQFGANYGKKALDFMFEYIDLNDDDKMFMYLLVYLGYGFSFNVDKKELTVFFDTSASFYLDNSLRYTTLKVNEISSFIKLIIETLNMSILNILILRSKKS